MNEKIKIKSFEFNPFVVIVLFGLVTYIRALFFGFTYLDDNVLILDNLVFLQNVGNVFKIFVLEVFHVLHAGAAYYRPILTLSFMIDSWFSGPDPFMYHLTNVLVHLASSCLLFVLLKKLKVAYDLAFVFSLIFSVHPALAQAVAWVPGRNDSLIALFFFASFYFYIQYFEKTKSKFLLWHLIFFALCLFTKESAVFSPLIFLFYSVVIERRKILSNSNIVIGFLWAAIFGIWYLLRSVALSTNPIRYESLDSINSILKNFPATLIFLGKVFLPINLSTLPTLVDTTLWYGITSLMVLVVFLLLSKPNWKILVLGIVIYLLFLIPSFIRPSSDYMADFLEHRQYLPILGLFLLISEIKWLKNFNLNKNIYLSLSGVVLVILFFINLTHLGNFANGISYWNNAVNTSPSHPLAHKNLGSMYFFEKNYVEAEKEYLKSLELNSKETMSHNNLGLIYLYADNFEKSKEEFDKELQINPLYDNAHFNLGLLFYRTDEKEKAEDMWLKTLSINPDYVDAYKALAIYYSEIKDDNKSGYFLNEATKRGAKF